MRDRLILAGWGTLIILTMLAMLIGLRAGGVGVLDLAKAPAVTPGPSDSVMGGQSQTVLPSTGPQPSPGISPGIQTRDPGQPQPAGSAPPAVAGTGPRPSPASTVSDTRPRPSPTRTTSSTEIGSSTNPAVFGQAITLTAVVRGSGTGTGTLIFQDGGIVLGRQRLSAGKAVQTVAVLAVGRHRLSAVYEGDTLLLGSSSAVLVQTVNPSATSIALSSSANPSVSGRAITLSVTVTVVAPGAGIPTGAVIFKDGTRFLGSAGLNGGTASLNTSALGVGSHPITVVYGGDPEFLGSTSAILTQNVKVS